MNITLLLDQQKFIFEYDGVEQEVTFDEVLDSSSWRNHKAIAITHTAVNEHGHHSITILNREVFFETMKEGDEEYQKNRGAWELNTTIHKLYAILDGKELEEAEAEITNISAQHTAMARANREFGNAQVEKIYALEQEREKTETAEEIEVINQKIEELKAESKVYSIPQEMKKMYFAARDKSKPNIKFSNVNINAVKAAYGNDLRIR